MTVMTTANAHRLFVTFDLAVFADKNNNTAPMLISRCRVATMATRQMPLIWDHASNMGGAD